MEPLKSPTILLVSQEPWSPHLRPPPGEQSRGPLVGSVPEHLKISQGHVWSGNPAGSVRACHHKPSPPAPSGLLWQNLNCMTVVSRVWQWGSVDGTLKADVFCIQALTRMIRSCRLPVIYQLSVPQGWKVAVLVAPSKVSSGKCHDLLFPTVGGHGPSLKFSGNFCHFQESF